MKYAKVVALAAAALMSGTTAWAQPGTGPVAKQCASDIEKCCAGKKHGSGEVRACLESNRSKLSGDCQNALDTTGGGRRMNRQ